MKTTLMLLLTLCTLSSAAQEIAGTVADEKKEPLINAAVQVYQDSILKGGRVTDYDGYYCLKPLAPGKYKLIVSYLGFDSAAVTDVIVSPATRTTVDVQLIARKVNMPIWRNTCRLGPPLNHNTKTITTSDKIERIPTTQVTNVVSLSPSVEQTRQNHTVKSNGAQESGTLYIINGVRVNNNNKQRQMRKAIRKMQKSLQQYSCITVSILSADVDNKANR